MQDRSAPGPAGQNGGVRADMEVSLTELVATLSYAADLGLGQPQAHCMRQTVIALRLADLVDATSTEREATYFTGLLANVFCHADAAEQARWFADDITFKAEGFEHLDMSTLQTIASIARRTALQGSGRQRLRRVVGLPAMPKRVTEFFTTHCALASQFAADLGLAPAAVTAIQHTYEQWDGSGVPEHLRGAQVSL